MYDQIGVACTHPAPEPESAEYCAHSFLLNDRPVRFRAAKTTPTKAGQFVTLWARSASGPIRPLDTADAVDLVVISSRDAEHFGHFVFPAATLVARGIVSRDGVGGKRGFRVYPPWSTPANRQATSTQTWQLDHYLPVGDGSRLDLTRARRLYRV
ncbi:MepB family protein [Actinoplanes awajinensis]|uniref:MepB domain containing protein n=1 Tax=Actinoplanes awajinensis subsp. mycoplanecinus TaxID=135947 RepID=A0A0X3UP17_9ACTN|nr:MepB family protein [Actinoplanes awajinensis]KUL34265.1 MepB domain containing protein [Actinoplanes awajinensis subsp. mycoplanecinus]